MNRLVRFVCWFFGHRLFVPVIPDPFHPITCNRCLRWLDADTGEWI